MRLVSKILVIRGRQWLKTSLYVFFQNIVEKHNLTNEEIQKRFRCSSVSGRSRARYHLEIISSFGDFRKWRENRPRKQVNNDETTSSIYGAEHQAPGICLLHQQSARESHSPHHQSHRGDVQAHAKTTHYTFLKSCCNWKLIKLCLHILKRFCIWSFIFWTPKLSHRLFNLGQTPYNKTGK